MGEMTLGELARELGGRTLEGDATFRIEGVAALDEGGPTDLGFVRSARFAEALVGARIGAVIAPPGIEVGARPAIRSASPDLDFARAAHLIAPPPQPTPGVHRNAVVSPDARVDKSASLGPGVVVGAGCSVGAQSLLHPGVILMDGATVGSESVLFPGVVVGPRSEIGDRVRLHPGVVIGADGFGLAFDEGGGHEKVPQLGNVVVEDDVEIGANSTVDRGRLGSTRIGHGTRIDNLVMVGHNCQVGPHCILVAMVGLAGSTVLEERVIMMGQSGASGHLRIGAGSFVAGRAGVLEDLPPGSRVWGMPAQHQRAWHRQMAALVRLPELLRRVRKLEKRLGLRAGGKPDA